MVVYEDDCVGCPPHMGCLGGMCPYKSVPYFYCDHCDAECDPEELHYDGEGKMICEECLFDMFPKINVEDY